MAHTRHLLRSARSSLLKTLLPAVTLLPEATTSCSAFFTATSSLSQSNPPYIISRSRHLSTGDECPHLAPGTLRLYSMKWCPFAQRTRLSLAHKQIRHEEVNINLTAKPDWLFEKNPSGTVPILEMISSGTVPILEKNPSGTVPILEMISDTSASETNQQQPSVVQVIGSLEICEWLEETFPDTPPLFSNITDRSLSSAVLSGFEKVSPLMNMLIYNKLKEDLQSTSGTNSALDDGLLLLENILVKGAPFSAAHSVSITDFLLWPLFERCIAKGYTVDPHRFPKLSMWVATMTTLPAVQDVRNSDEGYHRHWQSQKSGNTDYDFVL